MNLRFISSDFDDSVIAEEHTCNVGKTAFICFGCFGFPILLMLLMTAYYSNANDLQEQYATCNWIYPRIDESLEISITPDKKIIIEDGTPSSDPVCLLKGCPEDDS